MTEAEHLVTVGPVANSGIARVAGHGVPPAFGYRCSCGAHGPARQAANLTGKARNEALEHARTDGVEHFREAKRRPATALERAGGNVVDLEQARRR